MPQSPLPVAYVAPGKDAIMTIFISAGEPSGDVHGANLIHAIRRLRPDVQFVGFGGERMKAAGCRILYPLCELSVMGLWQVLTKLPVFWGIVSYASRWFRHHRPDAVILIDYPGMHWWLAYRAHAYGIPVTYYLPPQLWAWAPWRVKRMHKYVDHCLCAMPFEEKWYREHGVPAVNVGHPFFDELRQHQNDAAFMLEQRRRPGRIVALLPGSRKQEVEANFPTLLRSAERIHEAIPDSRFLVACFKERHRRLVDGMLGGSRVPLELHVGETPEIMQLAEAAVAVSGSVSLELMYHLTPTAIVYRLNPATDLLGRALRTCDYITLVNLLAGRVLFPEYPSPRCEAEAVAGQVIGWLRDEEARQRLRADLRNLRDEVAAPGASDRAARYVLETLDTTARARKAAA